MKPDNEIPAVADGTQEKDAAELTHLRDDIARYMTIANNEANYSATLERRIGTAVAWKYEHGNRTEYFSFRLELVQQGVRETPLYAVPELRESPATASTVAESGHEGRSQDEQGVVAAASKGPADRPPETVQTSVHPHADLKRDAARPDLIARLRAEAELVPTPARTMFVLREAATAIKQLQRDAQKMDDGLLEWAAIIEQACHDINPPESDPKGRDAVSTILMNTGLARVLVENRRPPGCLAELPNA